MAATTKKMIKQVLIVLNIAGLLGALIWLYKSPDWEPLITSIGLIASLIALIYTNSDREGKVKMTQKSGKNSKSYQSQGDININKNV